MALRGYCIACYLLGRAVLCWLHLRIFLYLFCLLYYFYFPFFEMHNTVVSDFYNSELIMNSDRPEDLATL